MYLNNTKSKRLNLNLKYSISRSQQWLNVQHKKVNKVNPYFYLPLVHRVDFLVPTFFGGTPSNCSKYVYSGNVLLNQQRVNNVSTVVKPKSFLRLQHNTYLDQVRSQYYVLR